MTEPELDTSQPLDEQTNRELRAKIAQRAAHRPPEHGLNKEILNSLHAWFTGGFYIQPAHLKPGQPPKRELVEAVVLEAIQAYSYDDFDLNDDSAENWGEHPVSELLFYLDDEVRDGPDDEPPQAMTKDQLRHLINAMDTSGDQRTWSSANQ